jgi:hypothetical protein
MCAGTKGPSHIRCGVSTEALGHVGIDQRAVFPHAQDSRFVPDLIADAGVGGDIREKIVLSAMPELSLQIVEFAREHGRVTIGDIATLTGTSRNTLKPHFRHLLEQGHLVLHGHGRGAWYALP